LKEHIKYDDILTRQLQFLSPTQTCLRVKGVRGNFDENRAHVEAVMARTCRGVVCDWDRQLHETAKTVCFVCAATHNAMKAGCSSPKLDN